jgi:hypothetical protein
MKKSKFAGHDAIGRFNHDLLNQLSVIIGNCDLLCDSPRAGDAKDAKHLQRIKDAAFSIAARLQRPSPPESLTRFLAMPKPPRSEKMNSRVAPSEQDPETDDFRRER